MEWVKGLAGRVRREPAEEDEPPEAEARGEPLLETAQERRERWRSVYVIYFTMFQMSLGFSIVLTGVWPYLDKVSKPFKVYHLLVSFTLRKCVRSLLGTAYIKVSVSL